MYGEVGSARANVTGYQGVTATAKPMAGEKLRAMYLQAIQLAVRWSSPNWPTITVMKIAQHRRLLPCGTPAAHPMRKRSRIAETDGLQAVRV